MQKADRRRSAPGLSGEADEQLFEALRALRRKIADEERVPPYVVFGDNTLIDMVKRRPKSRAEMLQVSGVADRKYERTGRASSRR